ncbi:MAG: sugar ABC transporter substrate-binding protein [Gaiellaceae bacterium]
MEEVTTRDEQELDATESSSGMSRSSLLKRSALMAAGIGVGSTLIAACGGDDSAEAQTEEPPPAADPPSEAGEAPAPAGGGAASGLFPGGADFDAAMRARFEGQTVRVGWTPPVLSEFFDIMEHSAFWMLKEAEDRWGITWEWQRAGPSGDFDTVEEHFNIVQNWVQADYDAIAICTAGDFASMREVYLGAIADGTAIYEFNQPNELWPLEEQTHISSITYDNARQSGYLAGTYIAQQLGGSGRILQVWGPSGHWAESRQNGLDQALAENPGLEVVAKADGGYVRDKGFDAAQNLLASNPDVDAIYGENEEMALGASQAIDAAGLKHWDGTDGILTIGADGLQSGYDAIREGRLTATIYVGTIEQGMNVVKTVIFNRLLGMPVDKIQNQPCTVVDASNVDIYEGLTKWALASPKEYG